MDRALNFELGQRAVCSAYIKRSGNHYEAFDDRTECEFWEAGASESVTVEDFHACDKFITVPASFRGVYVGTTYLTTRLTVEWEEPPHGRDGFRFRSEEPKPFAVVYYAPNKKRLVPLDAIWSEEKAKAIEEGLENG